jgi:protein-disulfide isomerase
MNRLTDPLGPEDHVLGRPDAPVTLVEYGDYECPFCGRAHGEVDEVLRRIGDDVRFAFRHFPLTRLHPHSLLAAQAAEAAGAQGRFWPMHALLFENQAALQPEDLLSYAEAISLDVNRFADELREGVHLSKVEHDFQTGVRSGVTGTPTFFVNGDRHEGGWDADSLTAAILTALRPEHVEARKSYL